jgi:hypothetical protein
MSVVYNSSIVTDSLILHYDMNNTYRSWLGQPTINTFNGFTVFNGITGTYVSTDSNGWQKYSLSGTWSNGTYPYSMAITSSNNFIGGVSYSASIDIYTSCPQKFGTFGNGWGGLNYVNDPSMTSAGTLTMTDNGYYQTWKRENFIYSVAYNGGSSSQWGYLTTRPVANGTVFSSSTDFVFVRNMQIEQNSFCSPYTPGTRTTSNSIIDLTRTNTLTISSLTYASNNTFSFNGANNYINPATIPQAIGTVIAWVRPSAVSGDYVIFGPDANGQDNWIGINTSKIYMLFTQLSDINNTAIIGNTTLSVNNWYQISCTIIGNTAKVYLNGVEDGTSTVAFSIGLWTGTSAIGQRGATGTRFFPGMISSVQLYSRGLSPNEIRQNFNATRGRYGL